MKKGRNFLLPFLVSSFSQGFQSLGKHNLLRMKSVNL